MSETLTLDIALKTSSFKQKISESKKETKLLDQTFKESISTSKDFQKSLDGYRAKLDNLREKLKQSQSQQKLYADEINKTKTTLVQLQNQQQKNISTYQSDKAQLETYKKIYGENSQAVKNLTKIVKEDEQAIKKQDTTIANTSSRLTTLKTDYSKVSTEANKMKNDISDTTAKLSSFGSMSDITKNKLNEFGTKLNDVGNKIKNFGTSISAIGSSLTTKVTLPIIGIGVASFKMASDTNEALNKCEVAFGDNAEEVKKWSKTTLNSYGIAQGSALDMAALFGDMSTSMGFNTKEASNMSIELVGLAGDLASFKNIGLDVASTALKSIFTGETESLKNLGIVMTQTNLDAYALASGFGKTTNNMTESEKVSLRLSYVMDKTKNSQGDFSRTSDEAANQSRIFMETLKELSSSFGNILLPVITPIISKINEFMQSFAGLDDSTKKTIVTIAGIVALIGPVLLIIGKMVTLIGSITSTIGGALIPAIAEAGGFMAFFNASILPLLATIGSVIAIVVILVESIKANWEGIKAATDSLIERCAPQFDNLKIAFSNLWTSCQQIYKDYIEPLFSAIGYVIEQCIIIVTPVLQFLLQIFGDMINSISFVWNEIGKPIFDAIKTIVIALQPIFSTIFNMIAQIVSVAFNAISGVWDGILKPVFYVIVKVIGTLLDAAGWFINKFADPISEAMGAVLKPIQWVIDKLESLFGWIGNVGSNIGGFLDSINPFSWFSLDDTNPLERLSFSDMNYKNALPEVALRGSYYTASSPSSAAIHKNNFSKNMSSFDKDDIEKIFAKSFENIAINVYNDMKLDMHGLTNTISKEIAMNGRRKKI